MKRARFIMAAAVMGIAVFGPLGARAAGTVCGWGGTAQNRTGIFTVEPGLRNVPSETEMQLWASGALSGDDPRCTGITLTIEGTIEPGSGCLGITHHAGTVVFTDGEGNPVDLGITRYEGSGPAYGRELFYGPDGELKATADPFARSGDQIPFTAACNSEEGLTQGTFAAVMGLVFLD